MRWIVSIARGLIYDQRARRHVMFYAVLAALLMAFCGDVFLRDWLMHNLMAFAIYWLTCGWLTALAGLLAIYDILMLRVQHRAARRELQKSILGQDREKP